MQRLKLTIRPEGLHNQTYFTAFILSNFWWPCCLSCSPGKFFAQQQLSWWWKWDTVVILIQCGCDMKCEAASDHDMNLSLSGPCLPLWPHLHGGKILSWYALYLPYQLTEDWNALHCLLNTHEWHSQSVPSTCLDLPLKVPRISQDSLTKVFS